MNWELTYERPDIRGITAVICTEDMDFFRTISSVLALHKESGKTLARLDFPADHSFGYKPLLYHHNRLLTVRHLERDPKRVQVCAIDPATLQILWDIPVNWRLAHYGSGLMLGTEYLYLVDNEQRLLKIDVETGASRVIIHLPAVRMSEHSFALIPQRLYFVQADGTMKACELAEEAIDHAPVLEKVTGITAYQSELLAWSANEIRWLDNTGYWRKFSTQYAVRRLQMLSRPESSNLILAYKENSLIVYEADYDISLLCEFSFAPDYIPMQTSWIGEKLIVYLNSWEGYQISSLNLKNPEQQTEILTGDIVRGEVCMQPKGVFVTTDSGLRYLRPNSKLANYG